MLKGPLSSSSRIGPRRISPDTRKRVMSAIKSVDTRPELAVRRILWALGARYRLHIKELPGRPDIVLPRIRTAIFVHGCFWHLHEGCRLARVPRSRPDYWPAKLQGNRLRDSRDQAALRCLGWKVLVIWECETAKKDQLTRRLRQLLTRSRAATE